MVMAKKKVEIVTFERQRIIARPALVCPVCGLASELLTPRQAAAIIQIKPRSIYRWLAEGKAHGIRTPGGQYRVCRNSLFARLVH